MLEIYNEKVQDLLTSERSAEGLKIREHPKSKNTFVENLT